MTGDSRPARIGFMLTQLGSRAAASFALKTKARGITPAQAGVIRVLGRQPGISQRALAEKLGAMQSRVVALIDGLEELALVARTRSATDRRNYQLHLTEGGRAMLGRLRRDAEAQEAELTRALDEDQKRELFTLLQLMSSEAELDVDVHPGYAARPNEEEKD